MSAEEDPQLAQLRRFFERLSATPEQADVMAKQLLKRAGQIAEERGISKVEAVEILLNKVIQARQGG